MADRRPSPVLAALTARCPQCGLAPMFAGYLRLAPRCTACGADFADADTGDGPAVFVMFGVGAVAVPLAMILQFGLGVPAIATIIATSLVAIGLTFALLRPAKALFVALQWRHRGGGDVEPPA